MGAIIEQRNVDGFVGFNPGKLDGSLDGNKVTASPDEAGKLMNSLQQADGLKDLNATVAYLGQHHAVDARRLGIVGFCMGGRVSYLMAAAQPAFKVAIDYYGGSIMVPWGDGVAPFARTAEIGCPLLGLFGEEDGNPSPGDMKKLDAELTRHGKPHEFHSYPGANHAFMNRRGARYHEKADRDSWPKALAFFAEHLGGVAAAAANVR